MAAQEELVSEDLRKALFFMGRLYPFGPCMETTLLLLNCSQPAVASIIDLCNSLRGQSAATSTSRMLFPPDWNRISARLGITCPGRRDSRGVASERRFLEGNARNQSNYWRAGRLWKLSLVGKTTLSFRHVLGARVPQKFLDLLRSGASHFVCPASFSLLSSMLLRSSAGKGPQ